MSGHHQNSRHELDDDDISTFSLARPSRPPSSRPPPGGPMPADLAKDWHAFERDIQHGPLSKVDIGEMLRAGELSEEADIWREGHEHWLPLRAYPELRALLDPEPAQPLVALSPPAAGSAASLGPASATLGPASTNGSVPPLATAVDNEPNPFRKPPLTQRLRAAPPWIAVVSALVAGLGASYVLFGGSGQPATANTQDPSLRSSPAAGAADVQPSGAPSYRVQLGVSSDESRPAVKQLVEASAGAMERDCWRPARATREVSAPLDAAVPVALTVKRSGRVDNARVSKNPAGYPGLASCVVRKVRDWQFERLTRDTNVNVTFHFSLPR